MMDDPSERPLSQVLAGLPADRAVTLGELLTAFGSRANGAALLLLALPDSIPIPIPSVSAVVGLPLFLVSLHLLRYGDSGALPARLRERPVPPALIAALRGRLAALLARAEALTRPRWQIVAGRERLLGLVCLWLSVLVMMPIPFFNTPPSMCLVLLAWGMIQRDGAFVAAGLVGTGAVTAGFVWLIWQAGNLVG
jgi:hypothetical protein